MAPHQRWTQTTISDLRLRLEKGEAVEQIADALGRTADTVQAMMDRLRLRSKSR